MLVGVCLDRSVEMVGALLGVLESGSAYVPLDPSYPADRLTYLLEDAKAPIVITRRGLAHRLADSVQRRLLFVEDLDREVPASTSLATPATPETPAYVIYTSGSTGKPKGVVVTHRNAVHSTHARLIAYPEPLSAYLLVSSFAFDSSVAGLFWTLAAGGEIVLPADELVNDPLELARLIDAHKVSHVLSVPSLHGLLLSETPAEALRALRVAIVAGETCSRSLVQRHHERLPHVTLYNEYGPTEASVWCTFARVDAHDERPVPIGRPIPNARVYVLDRHLQPVPIGVTGEVFVGGEGVAQGYWGRPDLTAEKFIADPFAHEKTARMYRTGDLARWRDDGQLEFLGRADDQVKLRGFRIEPGEIEDALAKHPAVRSAAVAVRDERLVAYVVSRGELPLSPAELRTWLRGHLPEHMVPSLYVMLAALPLSANGKVDRAALPAADLAALAQSVAYVAPRSAVEGQLAAIVADVMAIERVGVHDNLFELGLDSIRGVQVATRARRDGLELNPATLFQHQTIAEVAQHLVGGSPAAPAVPAAPLPTRPPLVVEPGIADAYPLSPVQQGMLFHSLAAPDSGVYVEQFTCELIGPLDVSVFQSALGRLFARHASLRASIRRLDDERFVQVVHESIATPLVIEDWSRLSASQQEGRLEALLQDDARTGFETGKAPLVRARLIALGAERHQLVWSNHHLLMDGWCLPMVLDEVLALYDAGRKGVEARLPERRPYRDYIDWLGRRDPARDREHWEYTLAGVRAATPLGIGRVTRREGPHETIETWLDRDHTAALAAKGRAHHLTMNTFVQGAWALLLSRYAGQDDIVFGTTVAGRPAELLGVESMIGLFINTLPLRVNVDEDADVLPWLHVLQTRNLELRAHEATPLTQVQAWSSVPRGRPLFESIVVFENLPGNANFEARRGEVAIRRTRFIEHTSFPLTLYAVPGPELALRVDYDADRFDRDEIDRLLGHLRTLLRGLASGEARRLGDLPWLTEAEEQRLLGRWTDPATTTPQLGDDDDLPDLDGLSEEELDALIDELT